jgi:hypothetical protein
LPEIRFKLVRHGVGVDAGDVAIILKFDDPWQKLLFGRRDLTIDLG